MPNTVIQLKKSATPSAQPASLANGELALNFADGILYYKASNGTIAAISGAGGGAGPSYGVVNANGTLLLAGVSGDTFSILPGQNITITGDAINDRVTINADLTASNAWANTKLSNGSVTLAGALTTTGQITANAQINITPAGGQEGGEIQLQSTGANTNWSIDAYQNNIRIFTTTGTTVSNLNFFHAGSGFVRMGVNRADPTYTVDVNGTVNASALFVNGVQINAGTVDLSPANGYTNTSTTAANNYAGVMANSANAVATATFGTITNTTAAFAAANQAGAVANNANTYGNSTYVKKSGDTITGDLIVQGNVTISGNTIYANTQTLLIGDNILSLNADLPVSVAPSEDAGIEINRGSSSNVSILWREGNDNWTLTNDGTTWYSIATNNNIASVNSYSNTVGSSANNYAGAMANSANAIAAATYATITNSAAAFAKANAALANGTVTLAGSLTTTGSLSIGSSTNSPIILGSDGNIELQRNTGGAYIDFKGTNGGDFDTRIQSTGDGSANGSLAFSTGGSVRVVFANNNTNGFVRVVANTNFDILSGLTGQAFHTYRTGVGAWFHAGKSNTSGGFTISEGVTPLTTPLMTILSGGNVGIGTETPVYKLDVNGNAKANNLRLDTGSVSTSVQIWNGTGYYGGFGTEASLTGAGSSTNIGIRADTGRSIIFYTNGINERARIDSSGNIGIGTTSPNYSLDVSGIANVTTSLFVNGSNVMASFTSANNYAGVMANSANAVATATFGTITNTTAAFAAANQAGVIANAAFAAGNNEFTFSNTVYAAVNSAFGVINSAFTQSNTDNVRLSAAYVSINAGYTVANAAFGKANGAVQTAYVNQLINGTTTLTPTSNNATINIGVGNVVTLVANTTNNAVIITLPASGVTAATYGNSTIIPVITVDAFGRVTSVANTTLTSTGLANTSGVSFNGDLFFPTGNVAVGASSATFNSVAYRLYVNGAFAANTKSFVIDHPTKSGLKLQHGSLEGPENGVYVRGKVQGKVIELPDYWTGLVDQDTITVQLTAIGRSQNLYVVEVSNNKVFIDTENHTVPECYYTVYGERKDVEKLVVEY